MFYCPLAGLPGNERQRSGGSTRGGSTRAVRSAHRQTLAFEYKFQGDAGTGDTLVVKQDPATFLGMSDPIHEELDEAEGVGRGGGRGGGR